MLEFEILGLTKRQDIISSGMESKLPPPMVQNYQKGHLPLATSRFLVKLFGKE